MSLFTIRLALERWLAKVSADAWDRAIEADFAEYGRGEYVLYQAMDLASPLVFKPISDRLGKPTPERSAQGAERKFRFTSLASPQFWAAYDTLSPTSHRQADKQLALLVEKPFHARLQPRYDWVLSIRVTRSVRALGFRFGMHIFWFWIGDRDAYEQFLRTVR